MQTKRIGVVLLNMGGPVTYASVKPFLFNLFSDSDIIKLGGGIAQKTLATLISTVRAPKVGAKYRQINACATGCGGSQYCPNHGKPSDACSSLNPCTELQRKALERYLQAAWPQHFVRVYTCFRYTEPGTALTQQLMQKDGITDAILLPLYPHFSYTTTGSSFREWTTQRDALKATWREHFVRSYPTDASFLAALNQRIDEALAELPTEIRPSAHLVFTAHGTPLAEVAAGDPYTAEIRETVAAIMRLRRSQGKEEQHWLGFQSRVGPAKWTQPNTEDLVCRLGDYGIRHVVMIPVAFVTDHIETTFELGIELKEATEPHGVHTIGITKGLNDHPLFIEALGRQASLALGEPLAVAQEVMA